MANNFDSNVTRQLMRKFAAAFEANRVLSKTVDTQTFKGAFKPHSGTTIDIKRPHDYTAYESSNGDISTTGKSDIQSGKATATVQKMITVAADFDSIDEALKLDQLDQIIAPMATRAVTTLELNLAEFITNNSNLSVGDPDNAVDAWADIGAAHTMLMNIGCPMDKPWYYIAGPGTSQNLAAAQSGLYAADGKVVTAWDAAKINSPFAGMDVRTSNCLKTRTITTAADSAGALTATAVTATYVGAKDSMTQDWEIDGVTASATFKAGDILEVTGKFYLNQATRETMIGTDGNPVKFRATITADATASAGGVVTVTVAGAAIYEASGAYNTVDAALAENDVVTLVGTSADTVQPNLFYHPNAVSVASVQLPKLYSTDTLYQSKDGFVLRCSKYADGDANQQTVRFDLLPAFGMINPFHCGQGFGLA